MTGLSLQDLTRKAFRYPEKGSINFNILENIILSILKKIKLDEVKVPYHVSTDQFQEERDQQEYAYTDDYLLNEEPPQVIETLWKSTKNDFRTAAAEKTISEHCHYIDDLYGKIGDINDILNSDEMREIFKFSEKMKELEEKCIQLDYRIDDSNEKRKIEIERLEALIKEMKAEQEGVKSTIGVIQDDIAERVAYRSELVDLEEDLNIKILELKELIPSEDVLVTKIEHEELGDRVEKLEEMNVFFANLESEVEILKSDMENMKQFQKETESFFQKISDFEDILDEHKKKFDEIQSSLEVMNEKLSQIDPDDINDSFARLEDEIEMIKNDMEEIKLELEECQKGVKNFSQKITYLSEWISRLEQIKMDKADLKGLLDKKADLKLIKQKLDRSEFALVIGDVKDIKENLERLIFKVQINEEKTDKHFGKVDEELSLQMYKEDFILGTEPIRNRIKALIYELKRVKEIALAHLFPDAPGIAKCMSCNRGAHMGGAKYCGDAPTEFVENEPSDSRIRTAIDKPFKPDRDFEDTYGMSVPPTDLDSVPFPPADTPREKNPLQLPVLIAKARPNIGLIHEKRRSVIDKELDAYFSKKPVRPIDAGKTSSSKSQQHTTSVNEVVFPQVTSKSTSKSALRKGSVIKDTKERAQARLMLKPTEAFKRGTVFPSITNKK